jgi:ABC-type multidrug transport system fused ATPase/permease subunit
MWPEVWKLMRPRRGLLALGFVLMVINKVAGFVLPYSSKYLIDNVVTKHQTSTAAALGFGGFGGDASAGRDFFFANPIAVEGGAAPDCRSA